MKKIFKVFLLLLVMAIAMMSIAACKKGKSDNGGNGNGDAKVYSITVSTNPTKTVYSVGDKIDVSGGKITVIYDDATDDIIDITVSMLSSDTATLGMTGVTVTYGGKTAIFAITVNSPLVPVEATEIATVEQFLAIATNATTLGDDYVLTADLDFSDKTGYLPISEFTGTLNGNGFAIKNLTYGSTDTAETNTHVLRGVFGAISGATIENTVFDNIQVSGRAQMAIVAGVTSNSVIKNCLIKNCTVTAAESYSWDAWCGSGGVVYQAVDGSTIEDVILINTSINILTSRENRCGTIAGAIGGVSTKIDNCYFIDGSHTMAGGDDVNSPTSAKNAFVGYIPDGNNVTINNLNVTTYTSATVNYSTILTTLDNSIWAVSGDSISLIKPA